MPELFSNSQLVGIFKGFTEKGLECTAEITVPYNTEMHERPQLGQFILIQLSTSDEASLGRITKFFSSESLSPSEKEEYIQGIREGSSNTAVINLNYSIQIKLLGAVRNIKTNEEIEGKIQETEKIVFVPSQRRLPHLGAKVTFPSDNVLKELCQLSGGSTNLGDYFVGEFVYSGNPSYPEEFMQHISPKLEVSFNIDNLVSRRSVVFARVGYGKSNLIKFLLGELYRNGVPKTEKGKNVGVLIFDADGEYFWPDTIRNRPGLCDVPQLKDNLMVFTNRKNDRAPDYYNSWIAGEVRIDLRNLSPADVVGVTLSAERQEHQNVLKLKGISDHNWRSLIDLIHEKGYQASDDDIGPLIGYSTKEMIRRNSGEINAARSNLNNVVKQLHLPDSMLVNATLEALQEGKCVVIDISLLSSIAGYNIAGLLMRKIFAYNQENFTGGTPPIPVISIIEEAQSVLGKGLRESSPFVEWVKEGRKYNLGAVLVTQQPGAMASEMLSQADNWFCFHLLSETDADALGRYNSHFTQDILTHLINEPIPGNCYMWSAPRQPFVLPVRVRNFEQLYKKNIIDSEDEPAYKNSAATLITQKIKDRTKKLAKALQEKIVENKQTLSIKPIYNDLGDEKTLGIYDEDLFSLIKEITDKDPEEIRSINELKYILLNDIFNYKVAIQKTNNPQLGKLAIYYCAPRDLWEKLNMHDPAIKFFKY